MRDAAAVVLLLLLALAWSGGNLLLALTSGSGPAQDYMVAGSAPAEPVGPDGALSEGQLAGAVSQAKADWLAVRPSADLSSISFGISDLPGLALGATAGSSVTIDVDAAGWGWQVMDLTTVVRHEIGHVLGLEHGSGLMSPALAPGASYGVGAEYAEAPPAPTEPVDAPASTTDVSATGSDGGTEATDTDTDTSTDNGTSTDTGTGTGTGTDTADAGSTGTGEPTAPPVEPMTMPEPVSGPSTTGLSTTSLDLADEPGTTSFGILSLAPTTGDDVITVVETSSGSYDIRIGGDVIGSVAAGGTVTVDGLDGDDVLVAPDLASVWNITGVNAGTLTLPGGATIAFSNIESLTGAASADDEFRFDGQAGLTGDVDDGGGQLTVTVAGFVRVVGDYGFEREAYTATLSGGGTVAANLLKLGGAAGDGFVGVEVLSADMGISGTLGTFALAVITAADQAWHAFSGTLTTPTAELGITDFDLGLDTVTVSVNSKSANDSSLNLGAAPIAAGGTTLNMTSSLVSATAPVRLDLGGFLFVSGNITLTLGGPDKVDVDTGLAGVDAADIPAALKDATEVPVVTAKPTDGSLATNADYTKVWNLEVSSLQLAFTDATAFVGGGFPGDADGVITKAEVEAAGAIGIFASGVNLVFVLLTPIGGMPLTTRFLGMKGEIGSFDLVGLGDFFSLSLAGLEIQANHGKQIVSGEGQAAVVDWVSSFPGPDATEETTDETEEDPEPKGYRVFIGGTDPPALYLDATGSTIGVSADRAVVSIGSFVHIAGRFALEQGAVEKVDVELEDLDQTLVDEIRGQITDNTATEDPGTLATNADGSMIWNLPVRTMLVGVSDGSVFVGYNPGGFPDIDDLELPFVPADGAIGILGSGIMMGLVLATPLTGTGSFAAASKLPSFLAVRVDVASFTIPGLPTEIIDFHLEGIRVEVNRGGQVGTDDTSSANVDWAASFPDDEAPGLSVATGGDPVVIDFEDPVIAVRADLVVLSIANFVHISGGFSLEVGGDEDVVVKTGGLTSQQGTDLGKAVNDMAGDDLTADSGGSEITGLTVNTVLIGISNANFFVGYEPTHEDGTKFVLDEDGTLVLSDDAVGLVATGINVGLVLATAEAGAVTGYRFSSFYALRAEVGLLQPVGIPEDVFKLSFEDIVLEVNGGGPIKKGPVELTQGLPSAPATSTAWIDWEASFPDENGDETDPPAGLPVPTGTTTDPIYIDFADPVIGISAGRVTLAISNFVFIQGGFSFRKGERELVDVRTSGLGASAGGLGTAIPGTAVETDPGDTLGHNSGTSVIWNLPVVTTTFGIGDAAIFIGYNPDPTRDDPAHADYDPAKRFSVDEDGNLVLSPDAVGFAASGIQVGLVFATAEPGVISGYSFSTFVGVSAYIGSVDILGLPNELGIKLKGIKLSVNTGGTVKTGTAPGAPIVGSRAVVDWLSSFPDPDGADNPLTEDVEGGPLKAGLEVPTGEGNDPVHIDYRGQVIGLSASLVTLSISDFVYIRGGFSFEKGGNSYVDVRTSGLGVRGSTLASALNGVAHPDGFDEDPEGEQTRATSNASTIWDVPVLTTMIGISDASVFIGYNPNAPGTEGTSFDAGDDGILDEDDLSPDAIGLLANNIDVGIVIATVSPDAPAVLRGTGSFKLPSFIAVRATVGLLTPVGLPEELVFRFEGIGLSVNKGGQVGTVDTSTAWVDWAGSFPEVRNDDDSVAKPAGLLVPTGVGNEPILIDFDDPILGIEAQRVVISIYNFVHISGGFAFEKGGQETVEINTGLVLLGPDAPACGLLATAATAATLEGVTLSGDCTTLSGVKVETIKVGVHEASIFVGYNPNPVCAEGATSCPVFDTGVDGVLQAGELGEGAIGFLGGDINVGFVFATLVRGAFTTALGAGNAPSFYTVKAHVGELGLVGVPGIQLMAKGAEVNVNSATKKWNGGTGALSPPAIDWAASLPEDEDTDTPAGLEIPTGGSNPPIYLDAEGFIIGGGANQFTLQISEFIYLAGSFYFEYGTVRDMPLTDGIVDNSLIQEAAEAAGLGVITEYVGLESKELQFMTIGAQDVHAFVGLGGPYWVDDDGDGVIDRDGLGQIIAAETNPDAVGLVLDDVDFAMAMMTPINRLDPTRYIALKASAARVALVGIDGLVADARNLVVELNISTPTLYGLPLLPVVDFAQWNTDNPDDQFAVKVGAPAEFEGEPVVVPFTFDSALIRASGQFNLNVFGVLALSGSLAFNLGKAVDATLADSAHTVVDDVVTMTIGGANLLGFVGYVPDNGSAWELNPDGSVHWVDENGDDCTPGLGTDCEIVQNPDAIGLLINDLDFGIFVGVKTPSTTDATAGVFVATNIVVDSFGLIGVPGITALGTLAILLNLGLALGQSTAVGGIDFKRTFTYDPDGEQEASEGADGSTSLCTAENPSTDEDPNCDDLPGLALDTGDPTNPVLIDFDTTFVSVSLAGVLNIVDFVQALGVFYLEADDQGLKLLVDAQLLVGPDKIEDPTADDVSGNQGTGLSPILEVGALGVLIIKKQGVAADLDVDLSLNVPGISVNASTRILFNSTGELQQVEIPGRLHDFLSDQAAANPLAQGLLDRLSACTPQPDGAASTVYCYKIGGTAPDLGNSTTVFNLLHNPTGPITTSGAPGAYVVVLIDGSFDFLGFAQASGLAGVRISGDVFQLVFNLHFSIGINGAGLDFDSSGFVEINPAGLILDVSVSLDVDVTSLFHLDVNGSLYIKTYGDDARFTLDLDGRLDVLGIFSVSGGLFVDVANDAWVVSVNASGRFGPVNIDGSGTIRSDGTFDLEFSAGFQIGPDVVHISANIDLHIYMENTRASNPHEVCNADDSTISDCGVANGGSLKFGFHLHGGAEACAFDICLGISIGVLLDGVISGDPANPSFIDVRVRGCVDLLFGDVCATIKVATIRLPGSIFPENDPKLAELQGGVLVLNVGTRGDLRVVSPTTIAEDYQIVELGTAANGTKTIQVTAFGRTKVYKGVTSVTGDFGTGNDSFTLVNGSVPVSISGGDGSDTLISNGTGSVTFNGNGGADMLVGGSAADTLNGGSGNDYLEGRGGIDDLDGGADDDTFVARIGDVFGESPRAGDGVDTYEIIGTTGADVFGVSVVGNALAMAYTGSAGTGVLNLTAFEKVVLQVNQGGDTVTVSGDMAAVGLQELTLGLTELTDANDSDTIVVDLTAGNDLAGLSGGTASQVFSLARVAGGDTLEYPAPPDGTVPLTTVSWGTASVLRLVGSGATDADLFTLNGLAGDDVFNLRGLSANTVLDAGDGNDLVAVGSLANGVSNSGGVVDAVDAALTVRGGSGTDTVTVDDSGDGSGDTDGRLSGVLLSGLGMPATGMAYSQLEVLVITLGTGGDVFDIDSTSSGTATTVNGNSGHDTLNVNDDHGSTTVNGNGGDDTVNVVTTHGTTTVNGNAGNDTVNVTDSFGSLTVNGDQGADTVTVTDTHAPTRINGGDGADTITVQDTHAALTVHGDDGADTIRILAVHAPTEAYGDAGNDSFLVGSVAPDLGGVLDLIAAYLKISGGAGTDAVRLDDSGDTTGDIGYVTDGRVSGLGMTIDTPRTGADPAWSITVTNAADGGFRITIGDVTTAVIAFDAKAKAVQDAINAALGGDFVTVTRSPVTREHGITYLIRWIGSFTGAPPVIVVDGSGLAAASGTPSIALATMTSGYIDYDTFETFRLGLGSGDDLLDVDSTQTGTSGLTTVDAGAGDDVLTVETTSGPTVINGDGGADSIAVNAILDPPGTPNGLAGGTTRDTTNALTLVGGDGSDTYTVSVWSNGDSRIVVADGSDDGSSNVLNVNGTEAADVFLLRSGVVAALNGPLTGTTGIQQSFNGAELITYDNEINAGLAVNGLAGDDVFALDDNSTSTVINGGAGDDSFFVGQMYGDTVDFDDEFGAVLTDTTRGQLTNGVSYSTTINGGTGNDLFSILRNRAPLQLNGEAGDDTFVIRTFLLENDPGSPDSDAVSNVSTGSGADLVSYVMNAPVAVDGGDGFDTLVLIGTEADDIFVISKDGLWGAGRYVSFVGIEKVDVDGAEGDDLFVVVSTSPTVQTRIFGGLGSDTILVGSAAPVVVADDLQGHSGIIEHSVESTLGNWTGIPVDGVGAEITDDDTPAVVITPTGFGNTVRESGGAHDVYTVTLTVTPSGPVRITVSAPLLSPDDEDARIRTVLVSFDQGATWGPSATATFDAAHMSREVWVKAIDDLAEESDRFIVLQHLVVQNDGDGEYDGLVLPNAVVRLIDDDRPAVTVVAAKPVRVHEGGGTSSYELDLAKAPAGPVTVRVTAGPQTRVSLDGSTWSQYVDVTFTAANTPVTIYVQGFDDTVVEGSAYDAITHTVLSGDGAGYTTGLAIAPVSVLVDDDDTPTVRVIETDGGTHVVEAGDTDSYQVVLGSNPCAGVVGTCSVTVTATAKPTKTRNGGDINNEVQVRLSIDGGATWHESVDLTFDGTNWDVAQTVLVQAYDDDYVDGSDYQAFAPASISRVNQIQGPLFVFGGENPNAAYTIPPPYMLPGESSQELVTTPDPAFDVIEGKQVDTLVLDNGNDVADETGTLTYDPDAEVDGITGIGTVTGLGLGGDRVIGDRTIDGGVTYGDLERLVIQLGKGVDTFTVLSTHSGRTEITGGEGNDIITVLTTSGFTRIDGQAGDDSFLIGNAGLLDDLGTLLVLAGGTGTDSATLDDSAEVDDQLGTITQETVTGLDMVVDAGRDKIYSLTVRGTGTFTITVGGFGSITVDKTATAEELQAALQALLFPNADSCGLPDGTDGASTAAQDSRCAQSVYVFRDGNTFLIGFTGELAGAAGPALTSSMTDLARNDGVNYYALENLTLKLGEGDDGVNVRGTSAATSIDTGAGDDLVFVSDAANLGNKPDVLDAVDLTGLADWLTANANRDVEALFEALLHGTVTIDDRTYHGSLDLIQGALDIDTSEGSNTLAISDRGDADADTGFVITAGTVTGLSGGAIGYTSTGGDLAGQGVWTQGFDSGLFGRGISLFLGSGGNTGTIGSVRGGALTTSPFGATITTIYTGEGHDTVTVTADAPDEGEARLVVHGQGGDDSVVANPSATQPLVLLGGAGVDTLRGGAGDDLVFGDTGRVHYLQPSGISAAYPIVLGGAPVDSHLTNPRTDATVPGDGAFLTVDVLRTAETGVGSDDTLSGRAGNDILLGGKGGDTVSGDTGNDLVLGDFGWVGALSDQTFVDTTQLPLSMSVHPFGFVSVDTTDPNGGDDALHGGAGDDILLGQQGADTIDGGADDDDIIGGHNIAGGSDAGDFITGGTGHDVVVGDNAEVLRTGSTLNSLVRVLVGDRLYLLDPATQTYYTGSSVTGAPQQNPTGVEVRSITLLDHSETTAANLFGDDIVDAGAGDDLVFGGLGDDVLQGGNGADYVEGNGGSDTIYGGLGQDDLIGGSSDLFGLTTPAQRPDGSDTVYGGTGTAGTRNHAGDGSASADADVMIGDNGNIYKVVGTDGEFESFTHEPQVIPRVVEHLDYSPTGEAGQHWLTTTDRARPVLTDGTAANIGAGDFLHGEAGNDVIHGMTGDDAIWGDAGDDDLYGQAGHDWVSGGTGTDGILGDDGLVLTSRHGSTEPLNGVLVATVQDTVRGNGPHHSVVINVTGTLHKAADLEPFYVGYNDVLYGGLGDDFLHGGEGDDAMSGGEALQAYYTDDPLATLALYYADDNPLQFGHTDPEEFRHYDENNPLQLVTVCRTGTDCLPFLTTADATGDDGDDALFGDGGSDWMSGGTGTDHLYGGWGNDLLDVDDDKTSNNSANSKPDNDKSADYAFGGAGRDVLIANTKNDRLIDWIGEFNSYLVPFNPYGASTIWRASSPGVRQFLYDISEADGADQTRAPNGDRNGEPYGELGLTSSADGEWGDQHGAPDDPQPGNGGTFGGGGSSGETAGGTPQESPEETPEETPDDTAVTAGTTTYGAKSFSTAFSAATIPVTSATVASANKKKTDVTVNLGVKQGKAYQVLVQVADLAGNLTTLGTVSIKAKSTSGTLSVSPAHLGGARYEMVLMPSADPTQSGVTLVIRQLA